MKKEKEAKGKEEVEGQVKREEERKKGKEEKRQATESTAPLHFLHPETQSPPATELVFLKGNSLPIFQDMD